MIEISVSSEHDQTFGIVLENRRVVMRLRWNVTANRYHMDLAINDTPVMVGRRVVVGADLIDQFSFGIGRIFVSGRTVDIEPTPEAFAAGEVRMLQATDAEIVAALA